MDAGLIQLCLKTFSTYREAEQTNPFSKGADRIRYHLSIQSVDSPALDAVTFGTLSIARLPSGLYAWTPDNEDDRQIVEAAREAVALELLSTRLPKAMPMPEMHQLDQRVVLELAQDSFYIHNCLRFYDTNVITWEQALILMVWSLNHQNAHLVETMREAASNSTRPIYVKQLHPNAKIEGDNVVYLDSNEPA